MIKCKNIKEKAKEFAIMAHKNQVRKNEPDKPMIMHPLSVGNLLEEYGYDENMISAGYLHDIIEDTKYSLEDIEKEFGSDIAALVMSASEPNKSLSWEERKQHTIDTTKLLPLRNKLIICADKINNLEDLMIKFNKTGIKDFSLFKKGYEEQKWYYTSVYESLINNEDENNEMFVRLKNAIDNVFYDKKDLYLSRVFEGNEEYHIKLEKLHAAKTELQRLKSLCENTGKPFVIELCGTPRTGKTTIINNLYDFFKKGNFKTKLVNEFTTSIYYKETLKPIIMNYPKYDYYMTIFDEVYKELSEAIKEDNEIILLDRSLNDRMIWNYRGLLRNDFTDSEYRESIEKYSSISKELIDVLVTLYTDPLTSLKRDYNNSLSLENRRFLNFENIEEYNKALHDSLPIFNTSVSKVISIDTTDISPNESSVIVAESVMPLIRQKYIDRFNKSINK